MRSNPLYQWLIYFADMSRAADSRASFLTYSINKQLDELSKLFNAPASRGNLLRRAEKLTRHIIEEGGKGSISAQDTLIEYIAFMCDPSSIPFWLGMLDWKRKREPGQYIAKRRSYALAALALLALVSKSEAAYDALEQAMYHDEAKVRGLAISYLGHAY